MKSNRLRAEVEALLELHSWTDQASRPDSVERRSPVAPSRGGIVSCGKPVQATAAPRIARSNVTGTNWFSPDSEKSLIEAPVPCDHRSD